MAYVPIEQLITQAQAGQIVSFPTDTVPALAVQPERASWIFEAKQRSWDKPLILMGAIAADLWPYVQTDPSTEAQWRSLADHHWPGALTLVLPASDRCPPTLNPQNPTTLGIRVPNHPLACEILSATGPLATTSANLSGQDALLTPEAIAAQFPTVSVLQPPWPIASGQPSTVAQWCPAGTATGATANTGSWKILRQGAIHLLFDR